ncbi:hypothetical protein ACLOJK_027803, partial [Asimina triloba]
GYVLFVIASFGLKIRRAIVRGTSSSPEGYGTLPELPDYWSYLSIGQAGSGGSRPGVPMAPQLEARW